MGKIKKVLGVTSKIIRWIWLAILSLLFIAGVVFQAPLKVLALVAIFLLACTILPLRWRKWFWAEVGVIVLVLVLWVLAPEKDSDWKPFTFDKELAALEAKREIPDAENAAIIYNQLLADSNANISEPNFFNNEDIDCKTLKTYWHSKDYPEVAKWLSSYKGTISKLIQASKFEKCKFDVTSKTLFSFDMERLGDFRQWAQLLSRAANNDIAEGKIEQGLKKNYCTLQMGKHICQQSSLVEILTGMAIENIAIDRLNNFVITANPSKKQLDEIEKLINDVKYDWESDLPRMLDYEKLFFKNVFGIFYEVNAKGQYRFMRNPEKAAKFFSPEVNIPPKNYLQIKLTKARSILYWFFAPATPQELSKTIDVAYQKFYETTDPNFDWSKGPKKFSIFSFRLNYKYFIKMLALMEESTYYKIHDLYLRQESGKNGSLLLIALRRYKDKTGVWPESLDKIKGLTNEENFIDPVNDQFFVYKLTGDSFTLYSKGKNGIDDNGERFFEYSSDANQIKKTADDIKIWSLKKYPKKSSKEIVKEPNE
ncbi:MAG: hypothetical protein NTW93_08145 [Phycisphaerae bacterium]|nr:hypothetical protein [Phycisphaerae bacterium]